MKGRSLRYFRVLLKRIARLLPLILALCILLLAGVSAYAAATKQSREEDVSKQIVRLGLVADFENKYIKIAMKAIEEFDYSRYSIEFVPHNEQSAREAVERGELSGYVVFPMDFFDRIAVGEHSPIRYYTEKEETAFGLAMTAEAIRGIAQVLLSCENSIYGIQRFIVREGLDSDQIAAANALIARYFAHAVRRGEMFEIVETGIANEQSYAGYFFSALLVFFLMLFGVCMAPAYTSKRRAMQRMLNGTGLCGEAQVLCEFCAHLIVMLAGIALVVAAALLSLRIIDPALLSSILPEKNTALWFLRIACLTLPFAAISYFIYEACGKLTGALLLQTLFALLTGYISGCFYPPYFFPAAIRSIGAYLPAGVAMRLTAQGSVSDFGLLLLYTLLPLFAALLLRRKRLAGDRA